MVSGAVTVISPPTSVVQGQTESDTQVFAFFERTRLLTSLLTVNIDSPGFYDATLDLPTPSPVIAPGTRVDSYLVHFDAVGSQRVELTGSITFDVPVLGIMVNNLLMVQSDPILGNSSTAYPQTDGFRGLDFDFADTIAFSSDRKTVDLALVTNAFVDQIRIVTATSIPEPNSLLLLATALPFLRRKR
jgi:hypothetical protein